MTSITIDNIMYESNNTPDDINETLMKGGEDFSVILRTAHSIPLARLKDKGSHFRYFQRKKKICVKIFSFTAFYRFSDFDFSGWGHAQVHNVQVAK